MKIRAEGNLRIGTLNRGEIAPDQFTNILQRRLRCIVYHPPLRLEEAFAKYGRLEIYIDGPAKLVLDRKDFIDGFIRNQQNNFGIVRNLRETLAGRNFTVLFLEDGPIAILARQKLPQKAQAAVAVPQVAIDTPSWRLAVQEVIREEVARDGVHTDPPNLDAIELNIGGPKGQELLAQFMMGDGEFSHETGEFVRAEKGAKPRIGEEIDEDL